MAKFEPPQNPGGDPVAETVVSAELLMDAEEKSAEEEIAELKSTVAALQQELAAANEMVASVERRGQIEQEVSRAKAVDVETACLLTEVAISEMDEPDVALAVRELRSRKPFLFSGAGKVGGGSMSAMVHEKKGDGLVGLAGKAKMSGDRSELLRYLRARRGV